MYNNFPWPQKVSDKQKKAVGTAAQSVLDARAKHSDSTLADLYDPAAIPDDLMKTHAGLDKAVDACYGRRSFPTDRLRVEFLFELYGQVTAPLTATAKAPRKRVKPRKANPS